VRALLIKLREPGMDGQRRCVMPPVGLWSLREYLQKHGCSCTVCDMHAGDIPDGKHYDIIGLSVQFSIQADEYRHLAERCRGYCDHLIAGGVAAAFMDAPEGVEAVCHGSGERFLAERFGIGDGEHVYPKPSRKELGRYWALGLPHDLKSATRKWVSIEFSRGCDNHCTFCASNAYWGGLEYFDLDSAAAHLAYLKKLGVEELFIEDDNFAQDEGQFRGILALVEHYGFKWSAPNGIYKKHILANLAAIKDSGCWRLSLPFETGSEHSARLMGLGGKYMPYPDSRELVGALTGHGIDTSGFFIIGYPGETLEDIAMTLTYANALPLGQRGIYIAMPYPGTALGLICGCMGIQFDPAQALYSRAQISTHEWTAHDIELIRQMDRLQAKAKGAL